MSRHKHKSRSSNGGNNSFNNMNNPLGLNQQMLEMLGLGNIDMAQLSNLFSTMGQEGFNLNSLGALAGNLGLGNTNMGNNNNNNNNFAQSNNGGNINPMELLSSLIGDPSKLNNLGINNMQNVVNNNYNEENDSILSMLTAVRSIVDSKKAKFLDRVIELYKNGEINY
jgi:hypothetical protein